MGNKEAAIEWITIAYHDLKSAQILFEVNHYTDSIGNDLQQSIEKLLKSILAYENKVIKKSHYLVEIYALVQHKITLDEKALDLLEMATNYFKEDRYPNPNYSLPPKEEIKEVLNFTSSLFDKVCIILNINQEDIK